MHRRRFVAALAGGSVLATAGCLGSLLEDLTAYEAVPAAVDADAAASAGYRYRGTREMENRREFGGQDVDLTSYASEYTRNLDLGSFGTVDAGVFAIVSTPRVSVAGREFNPVGDWSEREIAERLQEQYEEVSIGETVGSRTVEPLDTSTDVETFEGEATLAGHGSIQVFLDVGKAEHADDYLVALGVYPRDVVDVPDDLDAVEALLETAEVSRIDTMIENVRHDGSDVEIRDGG